MGKSTVKPKTKNSKFFPIIAIGASAGGLESIEIFFRKMQDANNIAFVIIQHLDPRHKSIMGSILKRFTSLAIKEIVDGMVVLPDHIYLNPPDKYVIIINGKFQLIDRIEQHGIFFPIDYFFRSLADDQEDKAICIVLSGTGSDGTIGLKAIKGAGGMTMAQDTTEAKYNGMPRSAIDTGMVDFILPVEKMPDEILNFLRHPFIQKSTAKSDAGEKFESYLPKIFNLIRTQTGHDFSNYKQNTINRRIKRRMAVHQLEMVADYTRFLQQSPLEVNVLFQDLLITVTNFFRDSEAFKSLQKNAMMEFLESKKDNSSFRVWVPGCATGEEAYSIAMLLIETSSKLNKHFNIQIFATDIDEAAIEIARQGLYPVSIAVDVSEERLKRHFTKEDNYFKINKQIREMVVFAIQNLIKDPPFSKLDLISCRNLLIYMNQVLQKSVLPLFHYTLNPNGILFLGSSESIGEFSNLFSVIDSKNKIFRQFGTTPERNFDYTGIFYKEYTTAQSNGNKKESTMETNARGLAEKIILENYTPPCVLVNNKLDILYFSGNLEKFLAHPAGEPSFNILKMAREELRFRLKAALNKAVRQKTNVSIEGLKLKYGESYITTDLTIRIIDEQKLSEILYLVVFDEQASIAEKTKETKKIKADMKTDKRVVALEQELQSTKEYLQTTIEELETSNEELKSTNEELQSTNQELQSTNEELETSKEEMQSTNEELVTVNSELQNKVDELSHVNSDINNLLASTEIATIFLNLDLQVKRFTPAITKIFNLIQSDIGRPISDITSKINHEDFIEDAKAVIKTLVRIEKEIQNRDSDFYSMRILPYRTMENVIDGVVITFTEITKLKQAEKFQIMATILKDSNDAITVQDLKGNVLQWNKGAEEIYNISEKDALKMNILDIIPERLKQEYSDTMEKIINGETIKSYTTKRMTKDGKQLDVWLTITKIVDNQGNINSVATTERDITGWNEMIKQYEHKIADLEGQLKTIESKNDS